MEQPSSGGIEDDDDLVRCVVCEQMSAVDAVLLPCLHSCCAACVSGLRSSGCRDDAGGDKGSGPEIVTCPSCGDTTAVGDAAVLKRSLLADAAVREHRGRGISATCDACRRERGLGADASTAAAAVHRCVQCRMSLCDPCRAEHDKFLQQHCVQTLESYRAARDAAAAGGMAAPEGGVPPASSGVCPEHWRELEFVCFQCSRQKCSRCLARCLRDKHSLATIEQCVSAARDEVATALGDVRSRLGALDAIASRRAERLLALEDLRRGYHQGLGDNRVRLLDWLSECHAEACRAVDDYVNGLISNAAKAATADELVRKRVQHGCDYGAALLRHDEAASALDQYRMVANRLRLLAATTSSSSASDDDDAAVDRKLIIDVRQPENFQNSIREFIGVPRLAVAGSGGAATDDDRRLSVIDSVATDQFTFADHGGGRTKRTISFHEPLRFRTPVQCSDVAVTANGRIVLATGMGLREYDAGGTELAAANVSCWYASVDAYGDGRLAAGNSAKRQIEVLSRTGPAAAPWRLVSVIASGVDAEQLAVAADGDLTAAANDRKLLLYDGGGRLRLSKTLDCNVAALAVAPGGVVLVSLNAVSGGCFLVEAYDGGGGGMLWRHSGSERTWGLCADRWGNAYLALVNRDAVRVLGADGSAQADLLRGGGSKRLASPWRLAVDRACSRLVVLSHDRCSLSVFSMSLADA